jgi:PEP-CTERM motif
LKELTMDKRIVRVAIAGVILLAGGQALWGQPPSKGILTFTTPAGTVSQTDSIPVWLTLLLDPSYALATDASGNVITGLTISDIQANLFSGLPNGVDPTTDSLRSDVNVAFGCSGSFTNSCTSGPPYDFSFNFNADSMIAPVDLSLSAESSTDYLFGKFDPTGGTAPVGSYEFYYSTLFIQVFDNNFLQDPNDPNSGALHIADVPIADTANSTSFTRDVTGSTTTPEPGTSALMLAGLGILVGFVRRKV